MKISTSNIHGGTLSLRVAGTIALCVVIPLLAFATAPSWWSQRGVLIPNVQPDDYAQANQGQLKNIARAAVDEMDARLPGGAGNTLHDVVNAWATPNSQTNDFAPVNLGQAKNVAKLFYDRLIAVGLAGNYPWTANSSSVDDFGIANLGQIKSLFSFDVPDTMAAPPSNLTATATSSTTVVLSWILGTNSACTTIQASIDGGITWFVVGVVGPGVSTATITGLAPGTSVMFAVSSGGISSPGGGNTFTGPPVNGTGGGSLNPGAAAPAAVTPLGQPVLEGQTVGYDLNKHGHKGFLRFSTNYYLTETITISTETEDEGGNWTFFGSTTTGYTFDPITGDATAQPPQSVGGGGYAVELYGGPGRVTVSDTVEQAIGTGFPGDHARSTLSDTLSDIYSDDQLRSNVESRIPPFSPQFSGDDDWAYIYFDPTGYSYQVYKLQYKWKVNADPNLVVTWDVQFTPDDGGPVQHEFHRWVTGGETGDSGASYVVDPRFRNGGANGLYEVVLLAAEPMMDGNRDGEMSFDDAAVHEADRTTSDKPYRFWLNDDDDTELSYGEGGATFPAESETVPAPRPDHSLHQIVSKRNLEDFARLWINLDGLVGAVTAGDIQIGLKWKNVTDTPALNIYPAADGEGSDDYLKSDDAAQAQTNSVFNIAVTDKNNKQTIGTSGVFIFKANYWDGLSQDNPKKCLLFEGAAGGKGELEVVFLDQNGDELGEGESVWLDLENIEKMYERAKAEPETIDPPYNTTGPADDPPTIAMTAVQDPNGNPPDFSATSWTTTQQYIVFVHGWNQDYDRSTNYAETMCKRLWQRGYKGRFATFRWPTYWSNVNLDPAGAINAALARYNDSEYIAWKSGQALLQYVSSLPGNYTIDIAAHSMGNTVVGSALQQGITIANYALLHAAVPAYCYDRNSLLEVIDFATPDYDPDVATAALGYRGQLRNINGNLINFYDANDSALDAWRTNNQRFRPQPPFLHLAGSYFYHANNPPGEKLGLTFFASVGRFVRTSAEAMAYVDASRSLTVGAEGRTAGSINLAASVDSDANFGFGSDHGAEWNFGIQRAASFYDDLMTKFQLLPNP